MVYEYLPTSTDVFVHGVFPKALKDDRAIILTTMTFPTALLATCIVIHDEAAPILQKVIRDDRPTGALFLKHWIAHWIVDDLLDLVDLTLEAWGRL